MLLPLQPHEVGAFRARVPTPNIEDCGAQTSCSCGTGQLAHRIFPQAVSQVVGGVIDSGTLTAHYLEVFFQFYGGAR
jgi:hypothetical protein